MGDDRQLAAIGAGGVLGDIATTQGATRLDELVRFADPAAADASLALREGDRSALGFYLDKERVHVGDAPADHFDELRAAWLSTDPKRLGYERIKDRAGGVGVAGESASLLHGIGDFRALKHDFVSPVRRQTQRPEIRYRQRVLDPKDDTLVEGLPVMTRERTIADLVEDVAELSLADGALPARRFVADPPRPRAT